MRKEITSLKITAPSGPGQPAVLECGCFEGHIHRFDEALEATFATEFPSCSIDELGTKSKADNGFERYWAGCIAIGYAQGFRAGKTSAFAESAAVKSRAAAAVTTNATVKSFSELVADQVRTGKSKADSVRFCIASHPREYALARVVGIPSI